MARIAKVGDQTLEFPDDTPDDVINKAVASHVAEMRRERPLARTLASMYAGEPIEQMGAVQRGLGGAKAAWDRAAMGLKGLVTDLTPEDKALLEQGRAFSKEGGTAATVGGVAADVAMSAPLALRGLQAANAATRGLPLLGQATTRGAAELGIGAGYGALTSPEDRKEGAKQGALGAAVGMGINRAVGGVMNPIIRPEARALMQQGIVPTPGQAAGGAASAIEQKLTSVPVVGDIINHGRNRSINEFNEAALRTAVPGAKGFGDDAVLAARKQVGQMYDQALAGLPRINVQQQPIIQAAVNAVDDPSLALSNESKKRVLDYVEQNLLKRGTQIDGQVAKRIESDLGSAAQRFMTSSVGEERAMGAALKAVHEQWRNSLTQSAMTTPQGALLREADAAWRALQPIDLAASRAVSQNSGEAVGRYTPRVLRRAFEALDKSKNNVASRTAPTGNTPYDQLNALTRNAEAVLPATVPDSGTAGRLALGGGLGAAGAGYTGLMPEAIAATAGTAAAYSRAGTQALLEGLQPLLRRYTPQQVQQMLNTYGPQVVMNISRGMALQEAQQ